MCGRVKSNNRNLKPGDQFKSGHQFGIPKHLGGSGYIYNARSEQLAPMFREMVRIPITVDSFTEGGMEFTTTTGKIILAGLVDHHKRIVILTKEADQSVKPYHHRMPVILGDVHAFRRGATLPEHTPIVLIANKAA